MAGIPFAQLQNTETLVAVYDANPSSRRTIVIVVEGDDDRYILERWFKSDISENTVAFSTPRSRGGDADGCEGVLHIVSSGQSSGVPIFGLVDRDQLVMDYRAIFLEVDDTTFLQRNPHLPRVRVLTRWEIESYLIDAPT